MTDIIFEYDSESDVLYASLGTPKAAKSVEYGNGIVIRFDIETGDPIGFTIIDYMKRINDNKISLIPKFEQIELPTYS